MASKNERLWIKEGYRVVAYQGFENLSIESIARKIQKSKSSFYHYFGDKEVFEEKLLSYHLSRIDELSDQIRACQNIKPGFLELLLEAKMDLFFHKQLRLNRNQPAFQKCFEEGYQKYEQASIEIWGSFFDLPPHRGFVRVFMHFFAENFLLKISLEDYSYEWLDQYLQELTHLFVQLRTS